MARPVSLAAPGSVEAVEPSPLLMLAGKDVCRIVNLGGFADAIQILCCFLILLIFRRNSSDSAPGFLSVIIQKPIFHIVQIISFTRLVVSLYLLGI